METFFQQIINGLVLGSMYALVALGYTMVYGIINLINFAHGDVLMVGALISWTVVTAAGRRRHAGLADAAAVAAAAPSSSAAALNFSIEKVAYRPLRNAPAAGAADHRHGHEPAAADAGDDHLEAQPQALSAAAAARAHRPGRPGDHASRSA